MTERHPHYKMYFEILKKIADGNRVIKGFDNTFKVMLGFCGSVKKCKECYMQFSPRSPKYLSHVCGDSYDVI